MSDPAEEIRQLQKLHADGALTDEEFSRAKAALISQMGALLPPPAMPPGAPPAPQFQRPPRDVTVWIHISALAGLLIPFAGFVAPIVLWQVNKYDPTIDAHGKVVANWIISSLIYLIVSLALTCLIIGFIPLIGVAICGIVFPIIGAIRASRDELWPYPISIQFFK